MRQSVMCKLKILKIGDGLKKGNLYQNGKPTLEPVFDVLTICQVCKGHLYKITNVIEIRWCALMAHFDLLLF